METPRQRLINLVHGGSGKVAPWIEKATLRRPGHDDTAVYCVHLPNTTRDGGDLIVVAHDGSLQSCHNVLHFLDTDDQPRNPETTPEELAAEREAWAASLPAPEDCGRIVARIADLENKD